MFFFTYLRRELRRQMRQAVVTAVGLAVGIGLVITTDGWLVCRHLCRLA